MQSRSLTGSGKAAGTGVSAPRTGLTKTKQQELDDGYIEFYAHQRTISETGHYQRRIARGRNGTDRI
ncbi:MULTISPECIES: hypothetical protein [Burkholderia cepacia complex]|uniref:hypothetical protein n=1 Tax=Burkholderia cepacia complex TaxID=87882 RepID=UPI0012D913E8|nr:MULTISPECIES: hypothetical protein [Burkholderia cepacia complex]MBR8188786.1 hypothetical protein [Burkholderia vietnamiensis]